MTSEPRSFGFGAPLMGPNSSGRRAEIERRRQIGLRDFDFDLRRIDASAAVDPVGHRPRPEDDDDDQNHLQPHPRNGAPVDSRSLDRPWCDAAQIEQRETKWRMHEAGLDIGADQHAEPDEVDAQLVGNWCQERDDDERDLEEIEEERNDEYEGVDEDQEADLPARQRRQ